MKNRLAFLLSSMVKWVRPKLPPPTNPALSPEQFRKMLEETLSDPQTARLLARSLLLSGLPVQGGMSCPTVTATGTNTNNKLTKWSDASNCTVTDSAVFESGGNVGIGTTTPGAKLEVKGSDTGNVLLGELGGAPTYGAIGLANSLAAGSYNFTSSTSDTNLYINRPTGKDIKFRENNGAADQMTILSGGNVGIGTTNPGQKLSVVHDSGYGEVAGFFSNSSDVHLGLFADSDGYARIGTVTNHNFAIKTNNTVKLVVLAGGNVGIGTTSPQQKLTIGAGNNIAVEMPAPTGLSATAVSGGSNLQANTTYYYVVTALDSSGETLQSSQASATTTTTNRLINLQWNEVPGAGSYKVYRTTVNGDYSGNSLLVGNPTSAGTASAPFQDNVANTSSGKPPSSATAYSAKINSNGESVFASGLASSGIGFRRPGASGVANVLYLSGGGSDVTILRNYSQEYTLLSIMSPPGDITDPNISREATIALGRGNEGTTEFLDIYNNGYSGPGGKEYGIAINKTGSGTAYHDFVFKQSDGENPTLPIMTLKVDRTVALRSHGDSSNWTDTDSIHATAAVKTTDGTTTTLLALTLTDGRTYNIVAKVFGRKSDGSERVFFYQAVLAYRQGGNATIEQNIVRDIIQAIKSVGTGWTCTIDASGNDVRVRVTGAGSTTVYWVATVEYQSVSTDS